MGDSYAYAAECGIIFNKSWKLVYIFNGKILELAIGNVFLFEFFGKIFLRERVGERVPDKAECAHGLCPCPQGKK